MSSILKALKKLEQDKARQQEGASPIAFDILRSGPRSASRLTGLLLAGAVLLLVGGLAAGLWWGHRLATPATAPGGAAPSAEPVAVQPPLPQRTGPAPAPAVPTANLSAAPAAQVVRPTAEVAARAAAPVTLATIQPAPVLAPPAAEPAVEPDGTQLASPTAVPAAPPQVVQLLVSGIAFQDDPEGRLAVVNDLPVMEGTVIEGVRVEQIYPDRVEFSRDGRRFVVPLASEPASM